MASNKTRIRHILKALTWRVVASGTTFVLALILFKDDPNASEKATYVALIEAMLKLVFYYYHERFWFNFKAMNARKRHLVKSVTWRAIASITTFTVAVIIFREDPDATQKAGVVAFIEIFAKMLIYYLHEEAWYRVDYGVEDREHKHGKH